MSQSSVSQWFKFDNTILNLAGPDTSGKPPSLERGCPLDKRLDMSYYSLCGELRLLIYRVELKLLLHNRFISSGNKLLIYRVELKLVSARLNFFMIVLVANLPCGVETCKTLSDKD